MADSDAPGPATVMPAGAPESALAVSFLLSASGGFLDAFTYLGHGGVFANAMTGNVVLLGVNLTSGNLWQAAAHIPPIVAFLAGVFTAQALRVYIAGGLPQRAALFSLGIEIATLGALIFLSRGMGDTGIVLTISFVAALQNSSFTRVRNWSYNSVMTTGNLRHFAESLFGGIAAWRRDGALAEARIFGAVCLSFLAGACVGGLMTLRLGNAALAAPVLALGTVLLLCLKPPRP